MAGFVLLAAWHFCYFTALFSNDTAIRLIHCFCFKMTKSYSYRYSAGSVPVNSAVVSVSS